MELGIKFMIGRWIEASCKFTIFGNDVIVSFVCFEIKQEERRKNEAEKDVWKGR